MTTNNGQSKSNNTQENHDKSTKFIRPWEELKLKQNRYGLGYEKDDETFFILFIILKQLHL